MFEAVIIIILAAILVSLGRGMFFLAKGGNTKNHVLNSLKVRIGLSIALVVFVVFGYFMGWIEPNNIVTIASTQK